MLLSKKWLSDYVKTDVSHREYEHVMTMTGSMVNSVRELSADIANVVAGRVRAIERHPDSDHLWVCQVDAGCDADVQIVTGAQNVRAGDTVPVALHKSRLPNGKKIEKGKLRGVKSEGMLCSPGELLLDNHDFPGADDDGILILTEDLDVIAPGDDIAPIIGADDTVFEFEITSNRPDCLSVIGLARETAAAFGADLTLPEPTVTGGGGNLRDKLAVAVENPELCPRYTAMMVRDIKIAPSPKWLRQRLRASGVRPINNIVDITNYVMLEYGQPMHAFDYDCLGGGKIVVRTARPDETMNTLDGATRALSPEMLVIADAEKAVGVAGVMGGENSEITDKTTLVVFESANFDGYSVRRTASSLGMRTDASSRFEKGLDIENTMPAVLRACQLVEQLGAGTVLDGIIDVRAKSEPATVLNLEPARINGLLGTEIPRDFMVQTLEKLGFAVSGDSVTVPSWRGDVTHYTDLAEEVARFFGYNEIEPTLFAASGSGGGLTAAQSFARLLSDTSQALGFAEICTYSFIGTSDYDRINLPQSAPERDSFTILNPLGEDSAVMRTTALPSLLEALSRNRTARAASASLYELAKVYLKTDGQLARERTVLTLGAFGDTDFYALKGAVETLLRTIRVDNISFAAQNVPPSHHPGRCAEIYCGATLIGTIGQIHPTVAKTYGLPETFTAELDVQSMLDLRQPEAKYSPLPRFPAVTRDLALVCDSSATVAALTGTIRRAGGPILRQCDLFDIYTGSQVPDGKKSVAFSLAFRDNERTLSDADVEPLMENILAAIRDEFNAVIR